MKTKHVIVVGGGIVGLTSAYFLNKQGHDVTIIDAGDGTQNCSVGNAGFICPSHVVPLAAPGMISQGLKWMLNEKSPFYVKPRLNRNLWEWLWLFYKSATAQKVQKAAPLLHSLTRFSQLLLEEIIDTEKLDVGYAKSGLLMVCQSEKALNHEKEAAEMARSFGQEIRVLTTEETRALNPGLALNTIGAVYYPEDNLVSPHFLIRGLVEILQKKGVEFHFNQKVDKIQSEKDRVKRVTTGQNGFEGDDFVFAGGSLTGQLLRQLGLHIPMQGGKGYSFKVNTRVQPQVPAIFVDGKVSMSPLKDGLRFSGTMEINGHEPRINQKRIEGIVETIQRFLPDLKSEDFEGMEPWAGFRPCSPDGLPYIGKPKGFTNVTVATGHAMLGLTLGAVSGQLVADLVSDQQVFTDISLLGVDRFGR